MDDPAADVTDVLRRTTVVRPSTATLMARLPHDVLAARFPDLRLDPDAGEPEFRPDPALRGLKSLHLVV